MKEMLGNFAEGQIEFYKAVRWIKIPLMYTVTDNTS
jgi:hypothetical protein